MKNFISVLLSLIALGYLHPTFAEPGESIVFNPVTGNYLITYQNSEDESFHQIVFIPRTKISPVIKAELNLDHTGEIHYSYTLISKRDSQQDIDSISLYPVSSVSTGTPIPRVGTISGDMTPTLMKSIMDAAEATTKTAETFDTPPFWEASMSGDSGAFSVGWYYNKETGGLPPRSKAVFGFKSRDLPGIIQAGLTGYAPSSQEIPGEETQDAEDGGFGQQYENLISNNFVRGNAAVPTIAIPTPFNAAVLLDRIQIQMHTWIAMQLLDATFSSQLDRYFVAAADAYRHNQPKAGKEHIETLRRMLKKEHEDLGRDEEHESEKSQEKNDDKKSKMIDRLAARVLDFNLKYVLKNG